MAVTMKLALVLFALLLPSTVFSRSLIRSARDAKPEEISVKPEESKEPSPAPSAIPQDSSSTGKPTGDEVTKKEEEASVASSAKPTLNSQEPGNSADQVKAEASSSILAVQPTEAVSSEAKPTSAALESESTPASVKVTGAASEDSSAKQTPAGSQSPASSTEGAAAADANPSTAKAQ